MASLREIRRKIKSVKSTLSVTKAMKMVAAAKLSKAQEKISSSRPFANRLDELLRDIDTQAELGAFSSACEQNAFFCGNNTGKELVIAVTADKGLCGAFNNNVIRKAFELAGEVNPNRVMFFAVGRKARDYFRRFGYPAVKEYVNIFSKVSFVHAELIGGDLIELFEKEKLRSVKIIYNSFKNALVQELKVDTLLPIEKQGSSGKGGYIKSEAEFEYEPAAEILLKNLLPRHIKAQVYKILLDSYAAEMSARMSAMESATKNALELIDFFNLKYNKIRQEVITRDLSELVSGAEALNW